MRKLTIVFLAVFAAFQSLAQVQIIGSDLNDVLREIRSELKADLGMGETGTKYNFEGTEKTVLVNFSESVSAGEPKSLFFEFTVAVSGNSFEVVEMNVSGESSKLILFYTLFWDTSLDVQENKGVTRYGSDIATIAVPWTINVKSM